MLIMSHLPRYAFTADDCCCCTPSLLDAAASCIFYTRRRFMPLASHTSCHDKFAAAR